MYEKDCPNLDDNDYSFVYRNSDGEEQRLCVVQCMQDIKGMDKLFTHLCSYKNDIWEQEKEWRLIAGNDILKINNPKIKYEVDGYKIPIPQNAIKSIIIGHNFPKDRLYCIREAQIKYGVNVYKTKVNIPFLLNFEDVIL